MELFGATVVWDGGGKLTIYDKTQGVQNVQRYVCGVFNLKPDDVRVISPYVGGAFGSGLRPQYEVALATLGALKLKRSVRLMLTRAQMYGLSYRPETIERIALGASAGGTLDAISYEAIAMTSQYEDFSRTDAAWAEQLYASANARYAHKLASLDVATPGDMRAPGAATGVYALECAMDELAVTLKLDPVELRLHCYSDRDQTSGLPYSSKQLKECYQRGRRGVRMGTAQRRAAFDARRQRTRRMGHGVRRLGGAADAVLHADRADGQRPRRGVLRRVRHRHRHLYHHGADRSRHARRADRQRHREARRIRPCRTAQVEGGSWTAASVAHAIVNAADDIAKELLSIVQQMPGAPLKGLKIDDVVLADGAIADKKDRSRAVPIADVMRHGRLERIEKERASDFKEDDKHAHNTHSAIFAEVKVDEELGVIRVTRVVNAVAAGRIINTKTAASQIMGGVVWGIGMALHEEALTDHPFGRIMNANIAEYHVPVNADVHDIKVIFVDEPDSTINPLGIKGVGEIGIVGVAAAIANAVYHATGKRVRDLPITLDKLD